MYSVEKALDILVSKKIVNDKQYWLDNYNKLKNVDNLLIQMANYIEPYKDVIVSPTPLYPKVEYYETANKTRILKGNLDNFQIACYKNGIANNKLPFDNCVNLTFFTYGVDETTKKKNYWATSILYANHSVQGSWQSNGFPKKQSVLIKYKDGKVEMQQIINITDLDLNRIDWVIGGLGLRNKDKLIRFEDEGFDMSVAYKTWKTLIGYSIKENRIWLITRPNIRNRKTLLDRSYDLNDLAMDFMEMDYLLVTDGGGSTVQYKDGKIIAGGSGRLIHSVGYFK